MKKQIPRRFGVLESVKAATTIQNAKLKTGSEFRNTESNRAGWLIVGEFEFYFVRALEETLS